ncbi:MACPF domain-containing protein [Sphingobacterium sp. PCS056]|uniref:MAC/perforin domain-containing protein n=1 Tax=Sphingobacterium sp. PCS056 TaxID=2931400 RepID=UPI00200F9340|nr:MAC/perforin domain-containing protein [Sphingobacterium sp. PCS056]UPZ38357.1 MACPF domain-containing protein [Sphingobacterium sp. PCS056]
MKRNKLIGALVLSIALLTNCSKIDTSTDSLLNNNSKNQASGGDRDFDLLGYGIDITGNISELGSHSDIGIIDMNIFRIDEKKWIDKNTTTEGYDNAYYGVTASDYSKELSVNKSIEVKADGSKVIKIPFINNDSASNFSASFKKSTEDKSITTHSSRYSYASFEHKHRVKRIRFTGDVSMDKLKQSLTQEFKNNVAAYTATELVNRYGTHILLDISIGGIIKINYNGNITTESQYDRKLSAINSGLGLGVLKMFNINITGSKTKEEITKTNQQIYQRESKGIYYGGTNSGHTFSIDKDGNTSENFSSSSWQSSINDGNAALIDIDRAVFIYEFITDPIKKAQVKAAVEKYIKDAQITELEEVPVIQYYYSARTNHFFSTENKPSLANGNFLNEGIAFYAFSKQKVGTVPVYQYFASKYSDHLFSRENKPTLSNGDFKNEGIAFYAYPSNVQGSTPIYQYYSSQAKDHMFSTENSPTLANGTFRNEGIAFYGVKTN